MKGKALAHAPVAVDHINEPNAGADQDLKLAVTVEVRDDGVAVPEAQHHCVYTRHKERWLMCGGDGT